MNAARARFVAGLFISAVALYFLFRGLDAGALVQAWQRLSGTGLSVALLMLAAGYSLRIVRWWWMLRAFDARVRVADCATPFLASIALNNVLPFRAGDAVRAFGFQRQLGIPASRVLGTVLIERLLDLTMLLVFFFAGAAAVPSRMLPPGMAMGASIVAVAAGGVLVALPFAGPWLARIMADSVQGARKLKPWQSKLRDGAAGLLESFALLRSGRRAAVLLPLTVLIWGFEGAVFATVAADLASTSSALGAWFAMATGTLATLLPSTPGYVGTFDYFTMLGLSAFGASREVATAFSLCVHAILWAPLTAAGLALFALHGGMTAF
ncbi:MAG: flippase-like domain-containing protein, partial [Ramlibacter sp.]|nr:flippase-like domain-containing protein [Ramlibacter sp.]